jgi:hypothetical protein
VAKHNHLLLDFDTGDIFGLALPHDAGVVPGPILYPVSCRATDTVGDLVHIRAVGGSPYTVERADPLDASKMPAVGVLVSKSAPTTGMMQANGEVLALYAGLIPGKRYFVGLDGRPQLPSAFPSLLPGERLQVQTIGAALDAGVLLLSGSVNYVVRVG